MSTTVDLYGLGCLCRVELLGSRADELAAALRPIWARCLDAAPDAVPTKPLRVALTQPDEQSTADLSGSDLAPLLQDLTQAVTRANIAAQTGRLLMLHAGAVSDPNTGRTLAYSAPGGTGKTTLTTLLGRTLGYLTDETVGVEPDSGIILPYPKPLSVRPPDFAGVKQETGPDALGLGPAPARPRLHRLVVLNRINAPTGPTVEPLDVLDAIAALAPESSALSSLDRPLQRLAALLDALPPVVRLTYSEASDVIELSRDLLEEGA